MDHWECDHRLSVQISNVGVALQVLGAGNSSLPLDLSNDGILDVTAVDISTVVVSKMNQQTACVGAGGLRYVVGDMMNLSFPDSHFDSIVEKGTLDVLFVENDSPWNPCPEVQENVHKMLEETHRVLKDGGVFVSITFTQPHFRKPFLTAEQYNWSCDVSSYGGGHSLEYFVYILKKGSRVKEQSDDTLKPKRQMDLDIVQHHVDDEDFLSYIDI